MRMNSGIILAGQPVNALSAIREGTQTAAMTNAVNRENKLADIYRTQGAGISQGDRESLNALAAVDPQAAMQADAARLDREGAALGMDATKQRMRILDAQEERAVKAQAAAMSAAEREATLQQSEMAIKMISGAQSPEQWDALASQYEPRLVGQFGQKDMLLRRLMDVEDIVAMENPKPQSGPGKIQADINAGLVPADTPLSKPGVVVNTGDMTQGERPIVDKPPKGFQRVWDDERKTYVDRPIPGGDPAVERGDAEQAARVNAANFDRKYDLVDSKIDEAVTSLQENGRWAAGVGSTLSFMPESSARELQATINTIKANLGFEELQAMRESSKTGGALGQVTERELAYLQAVMGNLDTAQSPEQLIRILGDIKERRADFRKQRESAMRAEFGDGANADDEALMNELLGE